MFLKKTLVMDVDGCVERELKLLVLFLITCYWMMEDNDIIRISCILE